jgi:hypothetical protein
MRQDAAMPLDPELGAILAAFAFALVAGLPGLRRARRDRRRALRKCMVCARTLVLGERTCDCLDESP